MAKKVKSLTLSLLVALSLLALCTACNNEPHVHENFTDEQVIHAPTCTADGLGSHLCVDCEERVEFVIPKLGHTEVIDQGKEATCTADGVSEGKHCSVCKEVLIAQEVIPAQHKPSDWQVFKKASCDIDGLRIKTCTVCNERLDSETIKKLGHVEGDWVVTKKPTCLNAGSKSTSCLTCGEVIQTVTVNATGHDEGDWVVTKNPTCLNAGSKSTSCLTCGEVIQTATISATGHSESDWIVTQNATCETSGSRHTICTVCKEELVREKINALGHDKTDWVTTKEPTCTATGLKHIECTRCDMIFDETVIEAKGHSYTTTTVAPTCTTDGYTENRCFKCEYTYNFNIVSKTGHEYSSSITQPTCTESGYTQYNCLKCSDTYKGNFTDPLGHNHVEITEQPTCLTSGKKYKECSRCKDNVFLETLEATGHALATNTYVKDMENDTTRTATVYECSKCDYKHVRKIVFDYSRAPNNRINANTGYSYGMTVDYSDLTTQRVSSFKVETSFTFDMDGFLGTKVLAHFYITSTGSLDKQLGFVSGVDEKVQAITNMVDYADADDDSKAWENSVDFPMDNLKSSNVYFVFINENYGGAFTVKTITGKATFDFGEPA